MATNGCTNVFKCTLEQAEFIAECAGLKHKITARNEKRINDFCIHLASFELWEDKQTAGGGCRICFSNNIVWISRHSGYDWADITEEVKDLFIELGCENLDDKFAFYNPLIYGDERLKREIKDSQSKFHKMYSRNGD